MLTVTELTEKIMSANIYERGYKVVKYKVANIISDALKELNTEDITYSAHVDNGKGDISIIRNDWNCPYDARIPAYYNLDKLLMGSVKIVCTKVDSHYSWLGGNVSYYTVKSVSFNFYDTEEKEDFVKAFTDLVTHMNDEVAKYVHKTEDVFIRHADFIARYKEVITELNAIPWEERNAIIPSLTEWKRENNFYSY